MVGRGDYQKQLAALVAAANASNLQFDDILPDDLKAHFQEMSELKRAREYVKELEEREQALQVENNALKKDLTDKQMEINNLPEEHQARKVELHQSQRQVELYKETSEDLSKRVARYRKQLEDIVGQQQATASATEKTEDLQNQIQDQQAVIDKLMRDNRESEAVFEQLRESDLKALERKDKQLAKKDETIAELRQQVKDALACHNAPEDQSTGGLDDDVETMVEDMPNDPLDLWQQNIDLLQQNLSLSQDKEALEDRCTMVTIELSELKAAYDYSPAQDCKAQLFAAVISEIKTMNRFYTGAFDVLDVFAKAFHAATADIPSSAYIDNQLDMAQDALAGHNSVKQVVRAVTDASSTDADQVALYEELDSLSSTAADSMSSLEVLNTGFWRFLNQLSDDPKHLSSLNGALCDAGRPGVANL